jgi:hypothetical protein
MTYKISSTELSTQPTSGRWVQRNSLGISGSGHEVYSGVREYELRWQLISTADYNQLQGFYNTVGTTGTVVVDLPKYGDSSYGFYSYTGCVITEPYAADYFSTYQLDVLLVVRNIVT